MKTFVEIKQFVAHPQYLQDRFETIATLNLDSIDAPIVDIVSAFADLSFCFPLQSCFGHFIYEANQNIHTLATVHAAHTGPIRYRIAYMALCIENSHRGRRMHDSLSKIVAIDPHYIQFGSANWFWERVVNSFILQVDPIGHKEEDEAILEATEARHLQTVRDLFFDELRRLCITP